MKTSAGGRLLLRNRADNGKGTYQRRDFPLDVLTKLEPDLFLHVTGLTVMDFHLLVQLKVFNTKQMNQAVFAFRRYEDASLFYSGLKRHFGLNQRGLYDTVVEQHV